MVTGAKYSTVKSGSDLIVKVGTGSVTLKGAANIAVKIDDGTGSSKKNKWTVSGTTATYGNSSKTLITVTGLKSGTSATNLSLNGTTVTLKAAALGTSEVSISKGYSLALASDVTKSKTTKAGFTVDGTTATYKSKKVTAGYALAEDKKSVSYSKASGGETLFTVKGLKKNTDADNLTLKDKTVTIKAAALGTSNVSISSGYSLALASDVKESETTKAGFTVDGTTATYKSKKVTAGYTLADDKKSVTYSKASGGETLFTVKGLKKNTDADNLTLKDKVVTLKAAALGTSEVSISKGYSLALASDVTKSKTTKAGFTVDGTTATYKSKKVTAGYALAEDKKSVSYSKASGGETLITLSGLKSGTSAKKLSLENKTVTLGAHIIGSKGASVNGGDYTYVLGSAGKLTNVGTAVRFKGSIGRDTLIGGSGKDTIYGNAGSDKLYGGKGNDYLSGGSGNDSLYGGVGNDTLTGGSGKDVFVYAKSSGNDVITDYTAGTDKIKISSGSISKTKISGKDVVFTIGNGTLTVKNGKGKKITIVDANGKTTTKKYSSSSKTAALLAEDNFATADNLSSIVQNNLSSSADKIETQDFDTLTQKNNLITYADK